MLRWSISYLIYLFHSCYFQPYHAPASIIFIGFLMVPKMGFAKSVPQCTYKHDTSRQDSKWAGFRCVAPNSKSQPFRKRASSVTF